MTEAAMERAWAHGAVELIITLLRKGQDMDANPDGRGSLRSHLTTLRAEIERALGPA